MYIYRDLYISLPSIYASIGLLVRFLMSPEIASPDFDGDFINYTFLESLQQAEFKNQCCHFFQDVYGGHLGCFSKWRPNIYGTKEFDDLCVIKSCNMLKFRFSRPPDSFPQVSDVSDAILAAILMFSKWRPLIQETYEFNYFCGAKSCIM